MSSVCVSTEVITLSSALPVFDATQLAYFAEGTAAGCRPHWRAAKSWPPDETLLHTLYLAEPAAHVEDAVNSIKVTRRRRSGGSEASQTVRRLPPVFHCGRGRI